MTVPDEQSRCPICQLNNRCGVNDTTPCWCTLEKVPAELIAQLSDEQKDKVCICQACIKNFNLENIKEVR